MFISRNASEARQREAQRARDNRAEITRALSVGEITRRDLYKWGLLTTTGLIAWKHGLSPFVRSAYAAIPTGVPRSPLGAATPFSQPLNRVDVQQPYKLTPQKSPYFAGETDALFPVKAGETFADGSPKAAQRYSWHTNWSLRQSDPKFANPTTKLGPMEGRPPGEIFAHQKWNEYFPQVGYVMSIAPVAANSTRFHPLMPYQDSNRVWTFGTGNTKTGSLPPKLIKGRYGEPMIMRIYNNTPTDRANNGGFGRNETQMHFHNAHNGAESDGAANVHHFPGTFYDYRWSTTLARADRADYKKGVTDKRACGPSDYCPTGLDKSAGMIPVDGDFREIQSTLWFHDHRFFFTAENVYKGMLGIFNMYSGPDRAHEEYDDGVNLRLPSGFVLPWGNQDFDVNLVFSDACTNQSGQYFFDTTTTDGALGDIPLVNFGYAPYMEVLPRKYRFRIQSAGMSRFWKLGLVTESGTPVRFTVIANDGNLLPTPVTVTALDQQGPAERFDIVVDFSQYLNQNIYVVNYLQMRDDGRGPAAELSYADAMKYQATDPTVGRIMKFVQVNAVNSVDDPTLVHYKVKPTSQLANKIYRPLTDASGVKSQLTVQIPVVEPKRTRVVEFGRAGSGDSRDPVTGQCTPDCPEGMPFPWTIKVNGQASHSMNANRVSLTAPNSGDVEHWTYVNGGGGWDHPIHLHFEEGVTFDRGAGTNAMRATEKLARKDVWRLGAGGKVTFQVRFGEFAGSYVNHCHNTVHEDFAMLLRFQILSGDTKSPLSKVTPTPIPTADKGVLFPFQKVDILAEGVPTGVNAAQPDAGQPLPGMITTTALK